METSTSEIVDTLSTVLATYGLSVIGAIILLIVGWWAAGWASRAVQRMLNKSGQTDETLQKFLGSLVRYSVIAVTVMVVLVVSRPATTPTIASGIVNSTMNGCRSDSNVAAITRYTRNIARPNAKRRLLNATFISWF